MKALILRDSAADVVATAQTLGAQGFQTICASSRALALALVQADMIDLIVMDERVGADLTHTLALSAERRNPYVSVMIMTAHGGAVCDDLFLLIPSLYALLGTATAPALMGQLALAACAMDDATKAGIAARIAADRDDAACAERDLALLALDGHAADQGADDDDIAVPVWPEKESVAPLWPDLAWPDVAQPAAALPDVARHDPAWPDRFWPDAAAHDPAARARHLPRVLTAQGFARAAAPDARVSA